MHAIHRPSPLGFTADEGTGFSQALSLSEGWRGLEFYIHKQNSACGIYHLLYVRCKLQGGLEMRNGERRLSFGNLPAAFWSCFANNSMVYV